MVTEIPLLNSKKVAIIDDEFCEIVSHYRWYLHRDGWACGFSYSLGFSPMHQLVLPPKGKLFPDHRDKNKLNNRKSNLRLATKAQNAQNSKKRKQENNTSKYKGVGLHKPSGLYHARIKPPRKARISLGYFTTQIAAARAYDVAARKHFGEFAHLNFE
jgi:hypothetical protein